MSYAGAAKSILELLKKILDKQIESNQFKDKQIEAEQIEDKHIEDNQLDVSNTK